MLELIEITIEEFKNKIYKEYIKLFPEKEQRPWNRIKKAYENGIEKFYKITVDGIIVGFFMIEKIENHPYYIDYFGIFENYQNKGYGIKTFEKILSQIANEDGLYIEIEKEDENDNLTIKRAEFYKKLGFKKTDSEYLLYKVLFTPYIYTKTEKIEKKQIDKIMFDYYKVNCGEDGVKKNCKIIK